MHDPNNPAEVAAEDFADRVLADLEDRAILEACGRYAAELEIEWADRGPLRRYAESRKKEAAAALRALVAADPRDPVAIVTHQSIVNEYLRLQQHIAETLEAADQAEEHIKERYPND